jgi:peptidoglycan hydrolase CwlO-like protein
MPATEDNFRSLRTLHVVSAASAFALLASTLWMMQADYADEWRGIQKTAYKLQAEQIDEDLKSLTDKEFEAKEAELHRQVDEAQKVIDDRKDQIAEAQKEVNHLDGQFQTLSRNVKFKRAE